MTAEPTITRQNVSDKSKEDPLHLTSFIQIYPFPEVITEVSGYNASTGHATHNINVMKSTYL